MRIALLSNVTVEVLAGMLRKEHAVWTPSGFGAWMETSLEPPAELVAFAPEAICLLIDRRYGAFDDEVQDVDLACRRLRERFPAAAVIAPDLGRLAADGGEGFYDEKMWALGKMPFSLAALRELKKLFVRKKVAAVDLDNTLWKGIVGEDGVEGIVPDVAFQRQLKELKERGIVLVALSKNNPADVEPVWSDPRMVLKKSDFVALEINWNAKAENLERVAKDLNLGTDAFVFVDDRPVERARMRAGCPDVLVADFPPQMDVFFPFSATTAEDVRRTALYQAESRRKEFAASLSVEDYLKGLEMWADVHAARPEEFARLAQLSQKTNQFNVCTNRSAEADIAAFAAQSDRLIFSVCSGDRFGDSGLVAFVHVRLVGPEEAEIVDWVMSCRVMNRTLEVAVENAVEEALAARGVGTLWARWRRTAKNAPVAELFDGFGFVRETDAVDARTYRLDLKSRPRRPTCVRLSDPNAGPSF